MNNFKKLKEKKRKTRLPAPPTPDQAGNNLEEPEIAPAHPSAYTARADLTDGRSLTKTGRTESFATRVTPEFKKKVKQIAARDGLKIVELLEIAVELYDEKQSPPSDNS